MDRNEAHPTWKPHYLIAFSTAAAAAAAVAAIATHAYLTRKAAIEPQELLARCQQAIENIERELGGVA